jgi:hypothetical protein
MFWKYTAVYLASQGAPLLLRMSRKQPHGWYRHGSFDGGLAAVTYWSCHRPG